MKTAALIIAALHHFTLVWNPNPPADQIDYYTVFMCSQAQGCASGSPGWFRLGVTYTNSFVLPAGPYVRTFAVTAHSNCVCPDFPPSLRESPKSQPITTHL